MDTGIFALCRRLVLFDNLKYRLHSILFLVYRSSLYCLQPSVLVSHLVANNPNHNYSQNTLYAFSGISFLVPQNDTFMSIFILLIGLIIFFFFRASIKKLFQSITLGSLSFFIPSLALVVIISLLSFIYPAFSFLLMITLTCIVAPLTFPYNISKNFKNIQGILLGKALRWLDKILVLDYLSVVFVKFFSTPSENYYRRLYIIFIVNFLYILSSRGFFVKTVFWNEPLDPVFLVLIYQLICWYLCSLFTFTIKSIYFLRICRFAN